MRLFQQTEQSLDGPLRRTIGVVLLGGVMGILDGSMVLVAAGTIAADLGVDLVAVGWVATAYLLAVTVTVPVGTWAVDRFGARRLWLAGLVLFFVGSVACAVSPGFGALVTFRVVQGVGAGILDPLMLTLLARAAGPERSGRVMGIMGIVGSSGPVAGPVLGGILLQALDWRWLFLVNVPIVLAAIVGAVRVLEADAPAPHARRLDVLGAALIGPGVTAAVLGLSRVDQVGEGARWQVLVLLGLAALLLGGYALHARRRAQPLVELRLLARRGFPASLGAAGLSGLATFGALFLFPLYFQQVHGTGPAAAGALLAPLGAASAIAMPVSGRLSDRLGARRVAVTGSVIALVGAALLAVLVTLAPGSLAIVVAGAAVVGFGLGTAGAPAIGSVFRTVPPEFAAQGSGMLYMLNQLGAATGIAAVALVLATAGSFAAAFTLLAAVLVLDVVACSRLPGRTGSVPTAGGIQASGRRQRSS